MHDLPKVKENYNSDLLKISKMTLTYNFKLKE